MPLITIMAVSTEKAERIPGIIAEIREAGSKALRCPPSNIWVMYHELQPGSYVQAEAPDDLHAPIVIIRAQSGRTTMEKDALVRIVAVAVSRGLSISEKHVWVHYQEMRPEDVWFDGHWAG